MYIAIQYKICCMYTGLVCPVSFEEKNPNKNKQK